MSSNNVDRVLSISAWAAVAVFFFALLVHAWIGPDIWYHLTLGLKMIQAGKIYPAELDTVLTASPQYINSHWLFQLVCAGIYRYLGIAGVGALFAVVWLVIARLWLRVVRPGVNVEAGFPLSVAAIILCQIRFEERPEVFSYLFLMLFLSILSRRDPSAPLSMKSLLGLVGLQVLWSNCHSFFVFGPLVAGVWFLSRALESRSDRRSFWKRFAEAVTVVLVLLTASTFSPYGSELWINVIQNWFFLGEQTQLVRELQPPWAMGLRIWVLYVFWAYWGLAVLATLLQLKERPRSFFSIALSFVGIWLSCMSIRCIPLLVFFSAPAMAAVLPRIRIPLRTYLARPALLGYAALSMFLSVSVVSSQYYRWNKTFGEFSWKVSSLHFPTKLHRYLSENDLRGKWFNHPSDGSYLGHFHPNIRLYADSRMFATTAQMHDYFSALYQYSKFVELDERYQFDAVAVVVDESVDLLAGLVNDSRWEMLYADLERALFVRKNLVNDNLRNIGSIRLYQGEDLNLGPNRAYAAGWVKALTQAKRSDLLQLALAEFGKAPAF